MKKVKGRHGGTLYAMEKGDPSPNKGKRKDTTKINLRKTQNKG